jgi:Tfp pilus assembly protein PilF
MSIALMLVWPVIALQAGAAGGAPPASAPDRGTMAPPIRATSINGRRIDTGEADGEVLVIVFGAVGQTKTQLACRQVAEAMEPIEARRERCRWLLVLSRSSAIGDLDPLLAELPIRPVVVHDESREIFGAYHILVVPTAVVIDGSRRIVHRQAAMSGRFGDIVTDALAVALGRMSAEQFERRLHAPEEDPAAEAAAQRADRLVQFARRLAEQGQDALAELKFREAIDADPGAPEARLALGAFLLARGRADEAGAAFRAVMEDAPDSIEAQLGLAEACARSAPPDLQQAARLISAVLENAPEQARAHFVMGLIHEKRGEIAAAAASYRRSAELLLSETPTSDPPDHDDSR